MNIDRRIPAEIITDSVNELTRSRVNREPYTHVTVHDGQAHMRDAIHKTDVPSLLDQLRDMLEPGGTGDHGHAHPASKPAFRTEAHDVLLGIDRAVQMWLRYNKLPTRHRLEDDLRQLVGATGTMLEHGAYQLAMEAKQWRVWARIATAWDSPAKTLHNTCPLCGQYGSLRIRLDPGQGTGEAMCVACNEAWDGFNISLLAEHIRWENREQEAAS